MSKLVYVCLRDPQKSGEVRRKIERAAALIAPDNIAPEPPRVIDSDGILIGIFHPHPSVKVMNTSVCLGYIQEMENWQLPNQGQPEGSFALFRGDENCVQVMTDAVASRTVWYYLDEEMFIAATSQRALIFLLGSFEFNREVIPWMLSTGSLGPDFGWDCRIRRLGVDSAILLDRDAWTIDLRSQAPKFQVRQASADDHKRRLREALTGTFSKIKLDYLQWVLLLSGGYDSRSILCLLQDRTGLRTVTWGLKVSLSEKFNDARIAQELSNHFGLHHLYFETDLNEAQMDAVFERYLVCGEGAIDHVSGYMDGFAIWKTLHDEGLQGVIRGDEGFGWVPVVSPLHVRLSVGIPLWSDFSNVKALKEFGLPEQNMPKALLQRPGETLETWRDRLYHQFRIPVVIGALGDLKLSYVEMIAPLLSHRIIQTVRTLPDSLRTDKALYKSIVRSISPKIAFARRQALADKNSLLTAKGVVAYLKNELSNTQAEKVLPRDFLDYVSANMVVEDDAPASFKGPGLKKMLKVLLPKAVKSKLKQTVGRPQMDFNALAFRVFLIVRMVQILSEDTRQVLPAS